MTAKVCSVFRYTAARDFFISNEMQMNQMSSSQIFVLENQTLTVFDIALVAVDGANLNLMSCNFIWVHWFMIFRCPLWNYQFGRNLYQDFSDRVSEVVGKQGGWKHIRELRPRSKGSCKDEAGDTEVNESPHFHPNSNPTKDRPWQMRTCTVASTSLLWCMSWCAFANLLIAWASTNSESGQKAVMRSLDRGWILASDFPMAAYWSCKKSTEDLKSQGSRYRIWYWYCMFLYVFFCVRPFIKRLQCWDAFFWS